MTAFTADTSTRPAAKSWLDRSLSIFADVRAGEGATAVLMLVNIFLLLVCYSVIKTVREPLILLGGGAEVRSYAAAGQAVLLMGFVPLYSWFASRVNRARLLLGVTLFFIVCIELFSVAVAASVPYVGVAFFIWVGIFNMSLVAQFWSFANDVYTKDAGARLFPIIMIGMTGGAPLGSFVAGRLFRLGFAPQVILQTSAVLLTISLLLYLVINRRETVKSPEPEAALAAGDGFKLVIGNPYLRLIALLVVLLNVVNTTGEYMVARLLSLHVKELAMADPTFNKQAFIGAFSGDYQFWVNVTAFLLQAFVTSRLVKYRGLAGVLFALPLIALGGYAIVAAGAGFSLVRWIKTAENATDYSVMNTARQLLWLPTSREEKYKAKQAIDTFFVRGGDLLSAGVVFVGTTMLHLSVPQFAMANLALTLAWLTVAFLLAKPFTMPSLHVRRAAMGAAAVVALLATSSAASAQQVTREDLHAAEKAEKAANLHPPRPDGLERRLSMINHLFSVERPVYMAVGGPLDGSGFALGPGVRARFGDTGTFDAHATYSLRSYKGAETTLGLPTRAEGRVKMNLHGSWFDAPQVAFFGVGNSSTTADRTNFAYTTSTVGGTVNLSPATHVAVDGSFDYLNITTGDTTAGLARFTALTPTYTKATVSAAIDTRTSPLYSRRGGLYKVEVSDYRQANGSQHSFRRVDAEVQQMIPLLRENWVLAFRALASTTDTASGNDVPHFLMPDLGGSRMLRGYQAFRFRDNHRMLLTGEYRWMAGQLVDMALFVDAGKVASQRSDLNFEDLTITHGIGLRIHTPAATVTRIEIARSNEGTRLVFAFSPSF